VRRKNFGGDGAPSVFRLAAAPNDSGWRRRRKSAAEGYNLITYLFFIPA